MSAISHFTETVCIKMYILLHVTQPYLESCAMFMTDGLSKKCDATCPKERKKKKKGGGVRF